MKPLKYVLAAAVIIIAAAFVFSCHKERNTEPVIKDYASEILKSIYSGTDCSTGCLQDGPFEQTNVSFTRQWAPVPDFAGYFKNNKYLVATAWHDEQNFYIKADVFGFQYNREKVNGTWTLTGPTYNNYPFTAVVITLNGINYSYTLDNPATTFTQSYPLSAAWQACDGMTFSVRLEGDGQPVWLGSVNGPVPVTYGLFGICTTTSLGVDNANPCLGEGQVTLTAAVVSNNDFGNFTGGTLTIYDDATDQPVASGIHSASYTYLPAVAGARTFHAVYSGAGTSGFNSSQSEPLTVTVLDCGCDPAMSGSTSCLYFYNGEIYLGNSQAVFTFIPGETGMFKIQGGLTNFTGENYTVITNVGTVTSWISDSGSDRIISVEGTIEECETVTVTVYWQSTFVGNIITGSWFGETNGNTVMLIDEMICSDIKAGYPPAL